MGLLDNQPGKPVEEPQPYKDPSPPQPADPTEDRPLRDPVQPGGDTPRS